MMLPDGNVWMVQGELLAANVVRLSWTTRNAERSSASSAFSDVGDESRRVWLRSSRANSSLHTVRLLNGTGTACEDDDGRASSLIDCSVNNLSLSNNVMPQKLTAYHHHHRHHHHILFVNTRLQTIDNKTKTGSQKIIRSSES